ncbi:MAG: inositol monophosphatase [Desulfatitalea sp.]|nr:inositol monophosphatase [Desulfatitalea sp.]
MQRTPAVPDIGELNAFALQAIQKMGQEALKYYGKGHSGQPFDQNLVTQAELHLNDVFQHHLSERFPDHRLYGREPVGEGYSHEGKRFLWVFDPLDGVDNFQTGIPIWGMSLALYENHWPVLGIFFMPATKDLFRATAGEPAYWNDRPIRITDRGDLSQESVILTFSRFNQNYRCRFTGKIRAMGSTGVHLCYVAMGRADAAIVANEYFKDLAAVRVIVESAGGKFFKLDGSAFLPGDYLEGQKIDEPVMVTSPANANAVVSCLQRW